MLYISDGYITFGSSNFFAEFVSDLEMIFFSGSLIWFRTKNYSAENESNVYIVRPLIKFDDYRYSMVNKLTILFVILFVRSDVK